MTPSTHSAPTLGSVGNRPSFRAVSPSAISIDDAFLQEITDSFANNPANGELLKVDTGELFSWALKIFQNSAYSLNTTFKESSIPLPKPDWVNLDFVEGASVCAQAETRKGLITMPGPLALSGVAARAWIFNQPLNGIHRTEAGGVSVSFPCFDGGGIDLTDSLMKSPLGRLFPGGKIGPMTLEQLRERVEPLLAETKGKPAVGPPNLGQQIFDAAQTLKFGAWIYSDPQVSAATPRRPEAASTCSDSADSLYLYLNVPQLRKNLEGDGFKNCEFHAGCELYLLRRELPLKDFPLLKGIEVVDGGVSLFGNYDKEEKTLHLHLKTKNISDPKKAQLMIRAEPWFGPEVIELSGGLHLSLTAGGEVEIEFQDLRLHLPVLPNKNLKLFSLTGVLSGTLRLHRNPEGKIQVKESKLKLNGLKVQFHPDQALKLAGVPFRLAGAVTGYLGMAYHPEYPQTLLQPEFDIQSDLEIQVGEGEATTHLKFQDLHWAGGGSLARVGKRYVPNLADTDLYFHTDLKVTEGREERLVVEGLDWLFYGTGQQGGPGELKQSGELELDVAGIHVGQFAWNATVQLDLVSQQSGESFAATADGDWKLGSITPRVKLQNAEIVPPKTDLGTQIHLSTDGEKLDWALHLNRSQQLGPLQVDGDLKVAGTDGFFQVRTSVPLAIRYGDKDWVRDLRLAGGRSEKETRINLKAGNVLDKAYGELNLRPFGTQNRFMASYFIKPLPGALSKSEKFSLDKVWLNGIARTPPLKGLFKNPRVFLEGKAGAQVQGDYSGSLKTDYNATLRYRPTTLIQTPRGPREVPPNFQVYFYKKTPSRFQVGPIRNLQGQEVFKGGGDWNGTLILTPMNQGVVIGGHKLGFKNGTFFALGQKEPVLTHAEFIAEQLWGIRRGTMVGRSIRLEGEFNLLPYLNDKGHEVDPDAFKRRRKIIVDRLPLSLDAYWGMFKKQLEREVAAQRKGGTP